MRESIMQEPKILDATQELDERIQAGGFDEEGIGANFIGALDIMNLVGGGKYEDGQALEREERMSKPETNGRFKSRKSNPHAVNSTRRSGVPWR
jgi:hypothetical protein